MSVEHKLVTGKGVKLFVNGKEVKMAARFSFRHISDILYHILEYDRPYLVIRAYGKSLIVDKHMTAMTSKVTTGIDRFDLVDDWQGHQGVWVQTEGPRQDFVMNGLASVFSKVIEHHESYLAKLIVE